MSRLTRHGYNWITQIATENKSFRFRWLHRMLSKVELNEETGCWNFCGAQSNGYGIVHFPIPSSRKTKTCGAHRMMYALMGGTVPTGMHLDHLCRNPKCCNPEHLEPVTGAENTRRGWSYRKASGLVSRKSHCNNGHPLSGENLREGTRVCRGVEYVTRACKTCMRENNRRHTKLDREKGAAA